MNRLTLPTNSLHRTTRPDTTHRGSRWPVGSIVALFLVLAINSGCTVYQFAHRTLVTELIPYPRVTEGKRQNRLYRQWAVEAWKEYALQTPDAQVSPEFEKGFLHGFADFVYAGGSGLAPAVPPRQFWQVAFRNPYGEFRIAEWSAGFRAGAAVARDGGYRKRALVPPTDLLDAPGLIDQSGPAGDVTFDDTIFPSGSHGGESVIVGPDLFWDPMPEGELVDEGGELVMPNPDQAPVPTPAELPPSNATGESQGETESGEPFDEGPAEDGGIINQEAERNYQPGLDQPRFDPTTPDRSQVSDLPSPPEEAEEIPPNGNLPPSGDPAGEFLGVNDDPTSSRPPSGPLDEEGAVQLEAIPDPTVVPDQYSSPGAVPGDGSPLDPAVPDDDPRRDPFGDGQNGSDIDPGDGYDFLPDAARAEPPVPPQSIMRASLSVTEGPVLFPATGVPVLRGSSIVDSLDQVDRRSVTRQAAVPPSRRSSGPGKVAPTGFQSVAEDELPASYWKPRSNHRSVPH